LNKSVNKRPLNSDDPQSGSAAFNYLDVFIKASQILSSETDLKQLLIKMMELLKSNTVADKIVLVLKENEYWSVQAFGGVWTKYNSTLVKQVFDIESIKDDLIPKIIFNYCCRSKEALVLENVEIDERFAKDKFIRTSKIKSIACIPIMSHGELMAMVYLENRKLKNVFNLERIKFLKLLSSQFGISAENALLYKKLNKKVFDLNKVQERYELTIAGSSSGLWDWDLQSDKVYYSNRFKELLGYKPEDISDSLDEFMLRLHPDDLKDVKQAIDKHLEEEIPYILDYRLQIKNNEYKWFHARGQAFWDETGKAIRMSGSISDITQRKKTESDLRISQERYELAISGSDAGIWDFNIESGEIYYSDRFNELAGYKPQEMQDTLESAFNRIHPDHREKAMLALNQHLDRKTPYYSVDYLGQTKSGEYRWFQAKGKAVWDEKGNATRVAGSFIDIHDQKEAMEKVAKSKERFKQLMEQSPLAMELLSPDGKINSVNRAWKKLWKVSDVEAASTVEKYNMLADPQLEKLGVMEEVKKAFKGKHIILPPVKYDTGQAKDDFGIKELKSFRSPWVQCHLNAVKDVNGAIDYVVNTYVDITDLKETEDILGKSEARYRHLVEHSPLSIAIFTPDGKLNQVNTAWKNLWGLSEEETRQVMETYNMFTDKQIENYGHASLVIKAFKGEDIIMPPMEYEGATTTKEMALEDIKAKSRWIQSHLYSVQHSNGDLDYVVNINMDLSKLKHAEIETQQQRDTLARIDRTSSMGQLTGSIAHELNQPLTGILSNAQAAEIMLKNKHWNEAVFKEILAEIISDTKRAGDVIRNLRALFQNQKTDVLPIEISTVLKEVETLLHSEFVIKDIDLTIQDTSSLPMIMGNRIQIQQVLVNLIMNGIQAMDFMEREERKLLIMISSDANELKVLVEDKGKGIKPEIIDRIFEPLATWKPGGTGMGLAISNNIIATHGGRMFAENKVHVGARVGFTIPVIKEKEL
jgi:PAS domain S-box-containing protein